MSPITSWGFELVDHERQRFNLVGERRDVRRPGILRASAEARHDVVGVPAPEVAGKLRHDDVVGSARRPIPERVKDVVLSVASRAEGEPDLAASRAKTGEDLGQTNHPGLVVRVVDDHDPIVEREHVRPSRVGRRPLDEAAEPLHDRRLRQVDPECRRCGRHGVLHVVGRDAG